MGLMLFFEEVYVKGLVVKAQADDQGINWSFVFTENNWIQFEKFIKTM